MKQLKLFHSMIGKTIKSIEVGSCHTWSDTESLVIMFDDNSYIIIHGRNNYTQYPDVAVECAESRPSKFLTKCGVFTRDELNSWVESEKKKEDEIVRENELKQLKRLKRKYERR